jgi:hypothetical protein
MVALAATAEGFPRPLFDMRAGVFLFCIGIATAFFLVLTSWVGPEMLLVSFVPVSFWMIFDEITTTYKTPFILLCTLILSLGVIAYHYFGENHYLKLALPILFASVVLTVFVAFHAAHNYWIYSDPIGMCFYDYIKCPPLPANHPAWWSFFFNL